ncbi:hypothetical protein [Dokdonella sp.]|uniref:hypothetical protein n=1 Tax=Dokdonella sp. TaxID=2291710 RepID=UPI003527754A
MSARKSAIRKSMTTLVSAALLAALSFSATAQSTATIADTTPFQATLMPTMKVTANASDPSAPQRWYVSTAKPVRVTLLPAVTVGLDTEALAVFTLPTVTVLADIDQAQAYPSVLVSVAMLPTDDSFALAD